MMSSTLLIEGQWCDTCPDMANACPVLLQLPSSDADQYLAHAVRGNDSHSFLSELNELAGPGG